MDWASTQNNLGTALQVLGQREKDARLLKRSVEAYKSALQEWTRERVPVNWAATFNNLGTVLRLLGEHRQGSAYAGAIGFCLQQRTGRADPGTGAAGLGDDAEQPRRRAAIPGQSHGRPTVTGNNPSALSKAHFWKSPAKGCRWAGP